LARTKRVATHLLWRDWNWARMRKRGGKKRCRLGIDAVREGGKEIKFVLRKSVSMRSSWERGPERQIARWDGKRKFHFFKGKN